MMVYPVFKPLNKKTFEYIFLFLKKLTTESNEECYYVGSGVLSKIVGFGTKLYANILENLQILTKMILW